MAEQLDDVVRPIAGELHALDAAATGIGPVYKRLQKLREVLGDEGLAKLVKATQGLSKKDAIKYYAERGLPSIGAALVSQGLYQQGRPDEAH